MKTQFLKAGFLQALNQITTLFITIILARELSVDKFGVFMFGISLLAYINLFSDLGLTTQGIKEISSNKYTLKKIVIKIIATKFLLSLTFFCLCVFYLVLFQPGENYNKFPLFIIILISIINCFNLNWYFNSKGRYLWYFSPKIILNCLTIIYCLLFDVEILEIAFLFTLSEIIISTIFFVKVTKLENINYKIIDFFSLTFSSLKED